MDILDIPDVAHTPRTISRWLGRLEHIVTQPASRQLAVLGENVLGRLRAVAVALRVWETRRSTRPNGVTDAWVDRTAGRVAALITRFEALAALDDATRARAVATALHIVASPTTHRPAWGVPDWEVEISYQAAGQRHILLLPGVPHDVALGLQLALSRYPVVAATTPLEESH